MTNFVFNFSFLNTLQAALKLKRFTRVVRASTLEMTHKTKPIFRRNLKLITDDGSEKGVKKLMFLFRENLSVNSEIVTRSHLFITSASSLFHKYLLRPAVWETQTLKNN